MIFSSLYFNTRAVLLPIRHPEDTAVDEGSLYHQAARVVVKLGGLGDPSRGLMMNGVNSGLRVTGLRVENDATW